MKEKILMMKRSLILLQEIASKNHRIWTEMNINKNKKVNKNL